MQRSTLGLYLAAWLYANGIPMVGAHFADGLTTFTFEDSDKAEELTRTFRNSDPLIPVREAFHALRSIQASIREARAA